MMSKIEIAERLFKYLNDNLEPTTKAGIKSHQLRDILMGVADWIEIVILTRSVDPNNFPKSNDKVLAQSEQKPDARVEIDFEEELSKL